MRIQRDHLQVDIGKLLGGASSGGLFSSLGSGLSGLAGNAIFPSF